MRGGIRGGVEIRGGVGIVRGRSESIAGLVILTLGVVTPP